MPMTPSNPFILQPQVPTTPLTWKLLPSRFHDVLLALASEAQEEILSYPPLVWRLNKCTEFGNLVFMAPLVCEHLLLQPLLNSLLLCILDQRLPWKAQLSSNCHLLPCSLAELNCTETKSHLSPKHFISGDFQQECGCKSLFLSNRHILSHQGFTHDNSQK